MPCCPASITAWPGTAVLTTVASTDSAQSSQLHAPSMAVVRSLKTYVPGRTSVAPVSCARQAVGVDPPLITGTATPARSNASRDGRDVASQAGDRLILRIDAGADVSGIECDAAKLE